MRKSLLIVSLLGVSASLLAAGCGESQPPASRQNTASTVAATPARVADLSAGGASSPSKSDVADALRKNAEAAASSGGTPSCCDIPEETKALLTQSPATQPAPATQPSAGTSKKGVHASDWVEPDKRPAPYSLDYAMTTQDGKEITLKDLAGQPWALTFLFTRCPNPEMCPLIAATASRLQRDLVKEGLGDKVRLVIITYDLVNDTPEVLKKYGVDRGFTFDDKLQTVMLRPGKEDFASFVREYQVGILGTENGAINHTAELLLIDKQGRFVRDYRGGVWTNKPVVEDLRKLADEKG